MFVTAAFPSFFLFFTHDKGRGLRAPRAPPLDPPFSLRKVLFEARLRCSTKTSLQRVLLQLRLNFSEAVRFLS